MFVFAATLHLCLYRIAWLVSSIDAFLPSCPYFSQNFRACHSSGSVKFSCRRLPESVGGCEEGAKISARLPDDRATSSFPFLFLHSFLSSFPSLLRSFSFSAPFRTLVPLTTPRGSIIFPLEIRNGSVYPLSKPVLIYSSHRCLINFLIVTFDRNVPRP